MRHRITRFGALVILVSGSFASSDWPRFRGHDGAGVVDGFALPSSLDPSAAAWSVRVPDGASSPVSDGKRVFLTGYEGASRIVLCLSAATGEILWRKEIARAREEFFHKFHGPATPTPIVAGRRLFVFFPDTGLFAFNLEGAEVWKRPIGPFSSVQGLAASPVVAGGLVFILVDTPEEAFLAAFDQTTGRQAWRVNRPSGVLGGYATPTVWNRDGGQPEIIVAGAAELTGYLASTGERLWWGPGITSYPTAPPFVAGDSVYTAEPKGVGWPPFTDPLGRFDANGDGSISLTEAASDPSWLGSLRGLDRNAGNNDGIVNAEEYSKGTSGEEGGMFRIRLGGRGDISRSHIVWRNTRAIPSHSGPLLYGDVLYTVRRGILSAFDSGSGKLLREGRLVGALGDYYSSPVAGDGKMFFASYEGVVTVVEAGVPWRVLSSSDMGESIVATPAIAEGRVLVRTASRLHCFVRR